MMTKSSTFLTLCLCCIIFLSAGSVFATNNVGPSGYNIAGAAKTPTIYTNTSRDYCPNGDFSPSVYDGTCTVSNTSTIGSQSNTINRPPLVSYDMDDERINELCESYRDKDYSFNLYNSLRLYRKDIFIICWMNDNTLTKFGRGSTFMGSNILRRDESSKFFYNLITHTMKIDPEITDNKCDYSDLDKAHGDLRVLIRKSCQIGLFDSTKLFNRLFKPESGVTRSRFEEMLTLTADLIGYDQTNDIKILMTSNKAAIRGITRTEAGHILYQFAVLADNSDFVPTTTSTTLHTNNLNESFNIRISNNINTLKRGETYTITVQAVDKQGNINKNYKGFILYDVKEIKNNIMRDLDQNYYNVPSNGFYKFNEFDKGEKTLSGFKVNKNGQFRLYMFDSSNENHKGSITFSVK